MFKKISSFFSRSEPTPPTANPDDYFISYHRDTVDLMYRGMNIAGIHGKKIIIACDGTWQDSNSLDKAVYSNVSRLCYSLKAFEYDRNTKKEVRQIVYYQAGVGTTWMQGLAGGGMGIGLEENVREAYSFIANNYHLGDEIYIFGFSRGAYTARSLAGFINEVGLLKKESLSAFPEIYRNYKGCTDSDPEKRKARLNHYLHEQAYPEYAFWLHVPIKVVGCWDTVGSLGIPEGRLAKVVQAMGWNNKYKFHNTALGYGIENAFQALGLDERRKTYSPTLWYLPAKRDQSQNPPTDPREVRNYRNPIKSRQRAVNFALEPKLLQCWFPGVHIDIGGGSNSKEFPEFSNLSFMWMVDQVKPFLTFDEDILAKLPQEITERHALRCVELGRKKGWFKDFEEKKGWFKWFKGPEKPLDNRTLFSSPEYNNAVNEVGFRWATVKRSESWKFTNVTTWTGSLLRTPGFYKSVPRRRESDLINNTQTTIGWTNEVIHPIVRLREDDTPASLTKLNAQPSPGVEEEKYWTLSKKNEPAILIQEYRAPKDASEEILYRPDEFKQLYPYLVTEDQSPDLIDMENGDGDGELHGNDPVVPTEAF